MRKNFYNSYHFPWAKEELNKFFRELRKMGYVARQNFSCCTGCAGAEIADEIGERVSSGGVKKETIRGTVFYTRQDNDTLNDIGSVYLAYGPVESEKVGHVGIEAIEVGVEVTDLLAKLNIPYDWSGLPDSKICVDLKQWSKNYDNKIKAERFTEIGANI